LNCKHPSIKDFFCEQPFKHHSGPGNFISKTLNSIQTSPSHPKFPTKAIHQPMAVTKIDQKFASLSQKPFSVVHFWLSRYFNEQNIRIYFFYCQVYVFPLFFSNASCVKFTKTARNITNFVVIIYLVNFQAS
jgi:hypothetical protein